MGKDHRARSDRWQGASGRERMMSRQMDDGHERSRPAWIDDDDVEPRGSRKPPPTAGNESRTDR
jgi:hypothetical protein